MCCRCCSHLSSQAKQSPTLLWTWKLQENSNKLIKTAKQKTDTHESKGTKSAKEMKKKKRWLTESVINLESISPSPVVVFLRRVQNPTISATHIEVIGNRGREEETSKQRQEKAQRCLRRHIWWSENKQNREEKAVTERKGNLEDYWGI